MDAQISIIDGTYSLIHIPLDIYSSLLQPILRTLLPQTQTLTVTADGPDFNPNGLQSDQHSFLNISVTPLECSVICHTLWAQNVFAPVIACLPKNQVKRVTISKDTYIVLSIISAGMDAASGIMKLTSPLALAGIPIFFITTYYSDFIVVPAKERHKVNSTLLDHGFTLSADNNSSYVPPSYQDFDPSATSITGSAATDPPRTPPPSNVDELTIRTFNLLRKRSVLPYAEDDIELVHCSGRDLGSVDPEIRRLQSLSLNGRRGSNVYRGWLATADTELYAGIVSALVSQPRFFSVTLAKEDPPSLLLDRKALPFLGNALIGDFETLMTPIFLDLATLPAEVTGIVCGVARKLLEELKLERISELSYLSTARAGSVILPVETAIRALDILKPMFEKEE